jgi:hypothetical protein
MSLDDLKQIMPYSAGRAEAFLQHDGHAASCSDKAAIISSSFESSMVSMGTSFVSSIP